MNDAELRNAFHRLRDEEMAHTPRFRRPVAVARPMIAWRFATALLLLLFVAALTLPFRERPAEVESIVTWKAPTDVLLRTPGSELLSTVPRIPERNLR